MVKAVFPGSFDPPSFGHLNIIERVQSIFEEVLVVVAVNRQKSGFFTPEERRDLLVELLEPFPTVSVHLCDRLIVEFARERDCKVLLRGVRNVTDFAYEFDLSILNKGLDPGIETMFVATDPRFFVLRSSSIKELASFGGNLSSMVPPSVARAVAEKVRNAK